MSLLFLLALQAAVSGPPAVPGRWVVRQSQHAESGAAGVSATLLSNDRRARMVVRCDVTYSRTISIQILPQRSSGIAFAVPLTLERVGGAPFLLIWELAPAGAFARNGERDVMANEAIANLRASAGLLRLTASDQNGRPVELLFDNRDGRDTLARVIEACPPPAAPASAPTPGG